MRSIREVCPICGTKLKHIVWGYIDNKALKHLQNEKIDYIIGGCMTFGDDRSGKYFCKNCQMELSENLKPIELITCPLEASGAIFKNECRNYELLVSKRNYNLLDNRELICDTVCPAIGKSVRIVLKTGGLVEGKLLRSYRYSVSCPGNHLMLEKKLAEFSSEYIDVMISDIKCMEII
ncbi:MAG: hypothetical protein Q4C25_02275 [Bacillota bacterium]|nr:hypothetical protein [Bacillota bacterium]